MPRVLILFISIGLFQKSSLGQQGFTFAEEIKFANHLINNYEYKDAHLVLKKLSYAAKLDGSQFDTINYLRGWIYYNQKQLDTSSYFLAKVSPNSSYYYKSSFYNAFNTAYRAKYFEATNLLNQLSLDTTPDFKKLRNFELAAYSLLQKNYTQYQIHASNFDGSYFPIASEEKSLNNYYLKIKAYKPKSKLLAGTMSAILPGSGKFYTGNRGQGATAFATVMALAAITAESYYRDGPKSIPFISFGALFGIFYVGNIWGSVSSVNKRNDTFKKEFERNVLLDMHIPLRRAFN